MQTIDNKIASIKAILPNVKRVFFGKTKHNEKEESIIIRKAQYIPVPDAWVTLEWSISQIEHSLEFLEKQPNDELEKNWIIQQIDTLNECLSVIPFPEEEELEPDNHVEVISHNKGGNHVLISIVIMLPIANKGQLVKELLSFVSIIEKSKLSPRRLSSAVDSIKTALSPKRSTLQAI